MSENESLISKIKKILDKASSTDSIAEKEALILKSQELLQKHNLDISTVENFEHKKNNIQEDLIGFEEDWESLLCKYIARNNFCDVILTYFKQKKYKQYNKIHIIGKSENVQIVSYLYSFFRNALLSLSIKSYSEMIEEKISLIKSVGGKISEKDFKNEFKNKYLNNYLIGGPKGVNAKMIEQKKEAMRNSSSLTSLMVLNDKAVAEFIVEQYQKLGKAINVSYDSAGIGFEKGYDDGKNISVNQGVENKETLLIG